MIDKELEHYIAKYIEAEKKLINLNEYIKYVIEQYNKMAENEERNNFIKILELMKSSINGKEIQ